MGEKITDLKITPMPVEMPRDKTLVHIELAQIGETPKSLEIPGDSLEALIGKIPAGERRETLENMKFALGALEKILESSRKAGNSSDDIERAVRGYLASGPLGTFPEINPASPLDATSFPVLLNSMGAKEKTLGELIKGATAVVEGNLVKLGGSISREPPNAFLAHEEKSSQENRIAERVGFVAELAYIMQKKGLAPMGDYAENNDCFSFCEWVFSIAKDYGSHRGAISTASADGSLAAVWYENPGDDPRALSGAEKIRLKEKAKDGLAQGEWGNGSFVKGYSTVPGKEWTGEHWGVYFKGYVYDFTGAGISKKKEADFQNQVGAIRWALNPINREKGTEALASAEPPKPQKIT